MLYKLKVYFINGSSVKMSFKDYAQAEEMARKYETNNKDVVKITIKKLNANA